MGNNKSVVEMWKSGKEKNTRITRCAVAAVLVGRVYTHSLKVQIK